MNLVEKITNPIMAPLAIKKIAGCGLKKQRLN